MKTAIVYYSTWGHVATMAQQVKKGIEEAGGQADLFQIPETLPQDLLDQLHALPQTDVPEVTIDVLKNYDAFLFGLPTRFGNVPAQFQTFWDSTGGLWASGALVGKPFGLFLSVGTGGGKEVTAKTSLSAFVHQGMIYIPLGYGGEVFKLVTNIEEVHGNTPWGAVTIAGSDGSRQPTELELKVAHIQGKTFYPLAKKIVDSQAVEESSSKSSSVAEKTVAAAPKERATQAVVAPEEKNDSCGIKCIIM